MEEAAGRSGLPLVQIVASGSPSTHGSGAAFDGAPLAPEEGSVGDSLRQPLTAPWHATRLSNAQP